jgi:hypothetical protein
MIKLLGTAFNGGNSSQNRSGRRKDVSLLFDGALFLAIENIQPPLQLLFRANLTLSYMDFLLGEWTYQNS